MNFSELGILPSMLDVLEKEGYNSPTPIQTLAIPEVLKGRDIIACARTGTGKTAAFALPVIQRLLAQPNLKSKVRALVLTPTRELAIQIADNAKIYSRNNPVNIQLLLGGVSYGPQRTALEGNIDFLVATPGRLIDHLQQGNADISMVETLILDEADRMLDLGFLNAVKKIISLLPKRRQTLFFTATMPDNIRKLAREILYKPVEVTAEKDENIEKPIQQYVCFADKAEKKVKLESLLASGKQLQTLVFTRTKHGADKLSKTLNAKGIAAAAIHGNKSQNARQRALSDFKEARIQTLIATDIAARGIDIDGLPRVINFELPEVPETYVHRIGRTGRAGNDGLAISFCAPDEMDDLKGIQKLLGFKIQELKMEATTKK